MIRLFTAIISIIASLIAVMFGSHPVWAVAACLVGLFLIAWYCVSKFEDNQGIALN